MKLPKKKPAAADPADRLLARLADRPSSLDRRLGIAPPPIPPLSDVADPDLDLEASSQAEVAALADSFHARAQRDEERRRLAEDTDFTVTLCFQSSGQLDAFLAGAGLDDLADTTRILNGLEVARRFGIKLPTVTLTKKRQANETWRRYVK